VTVRVNRQRLEVPDLTISILSFNFKSVIPFGTDRQLSCET
jgi:hypothetical protein